MSFWLCQGLQEGTACQARCLDVNLDHMTWTDPTSYITDVGQGELFGVWGHWESKNSISSIETMLFECFPCFPCRVCDVRFFTAVAWLQC